MKVYDLQCAQKHQFEGWFSSADDFAAQLEKGQVQCPLCDSTDVRRLLSAPRLNLARDEAPANPRDIDFQAQWLTMARHLMAHTEDVGSRFAEQARRMHYDEMPAHGIRGVASDDECQALAEEGIDVIQIALPTALKQSLQ